MPNIKILNHVVLDNGTKLKSLRVGNGLYQYTEQGMLIYPIGGVVPIIVKGQGCIGLAVITRILEMTADNTTVEFEYSPIDERAAKVMYTLLYRNNASMTSGLGEYDPYDNTDVMIPGAMSLKPSNNLADGLSSKGKGLMNDERFGPFRGNRRTHDNIDTGYDHRDYD